MPRPPTPPSLPPRPKSREAQLLISSSNWPHRLLHLPSMTSHTREGLDIYNGVKAPQYNIISCTWGNFIDSTATAISVAGIDWSVPAVMEGYFTPDTFMAAIKRATKGVEHSYDLALA